MVLVTTYISQIVTLNIKHFSQAPVAHTYNPSYSGGRDPENHISKPDQENFLETLSQKNPSQKRTGGVAQSVGPEFKPQ
jgi:hypothetical protein